MDQDTGVSPAITFLRRRPTSLPFLVCVRAGARTIHGEWYKPRHPRNWDFMLNYYEIPSIGWDEQADIVVTGGLSKFTAVKAIHSSAPDLFTDYRAVFFVDDDIMIDFADIDRLFSIFVEAGLELAQPALSHASYHSWVTTLACPSFHLRYTNYVEVMMPVFSRSAFLACVDSFDQCVSGYGLDFAWPVLLGNPLDRIAVIDAVTATHTRPIDLANGPFYRFLRSVGVDPFDEWRKIGERYGVTDAKPKVLGVVTRPIEGKRRIIFPAAGP